ncbi:glycosyltransferase [Brevibacillus brevis]|uniref:glycosyltransferase n=1 Tax=Brevibacillus brevis TaxID=1393 RepID=UPI001F2DBC93|nr:glycosyltransferase [Brevibacillus brevis]UIO42436.1 glycosyltransferase [Brevibacillus brevis]
MSEVPKISLCMIVKNEEECLHKCMESVKDLVDEMIIVDTGSTDNTVEICKSFGAVVHSYEWQDNFAEARNFGLEKATGDWILWMDADEEMNKEDSKNLKELLRGQEDSLFYIHLINYIGDEINEDDAFHIAHSRLFRNGIGFRFHFPIHETLNVEEVLPNLTEDLHIQILPVRIYHYGYMNECTGRKNKFERNIGLLMKELEKEDHSPWIEYHLASEFSRIQEHEKTFKFVNLSIIGFLENHMMPPSLLYKLKYSTLIAIGSAEGAWPGIEKAIEMYPDYVDLRLYKGIIQYLKKDYKRALMTFDHCLELGESNIRHLTLKGSGSFHAWYYKGLCYEGLDQVEEAVAAYQTVLAMAKNHAPAKEALEKLCSTAKVSHTSNNK